MQVRGGFSLNYLVRQLLQISLKFSLTIQIKISPVSIRLRFGATRHGITGANVDEDPWHHMEW